MPFSGLPSRHGGGAARLQTGHLGPGGRQVVAVDLRGSERGAPLGTEGARLLARAAELALQRRVPLVAHLCFSGTDLVEGIPALDGWGRAARAWARCSGVVPLVAVVEDAVLSGPALLLGLADAVVMTSRALCFISGPAAVAEVTGQSVRPGELGGAGVHSTRSGLATVVAPGPVEAITAAAHLVGFLPSHTDELLPVLNSLDPPTRLTPQLRDVIPPSPVGSYDVRLVIEAVADQGDMLELRAGWAPQLVTALVRVAGRSVGVIANQPQSMAGTLDITASQKGARFVAFCDSFNIPLLTVVDTPGFMPGRDLEWRGMIRHGAELVFAYAEATVPRICLVMRKAYGGAYIVMDSKAMGNDICLAWPSAELAVMGASGAVSVLHRRASAEERARLAVEYEERFLNPYVAAERGYVDMVIDPAETRQAVARCLDVLASKRERLIRRKHANSPL
ncbi:MAG TPA: carboxyl transferase domain-containing protein [Acidimicrobiales bacterium]|nr:carboxyl transferase domain-containing protein [Acidimicrobiales bacterium]